VPSEGLVPSRLFRAEFDRLSTPANARRIRAPRATVESASRASRVKFLNDLSWRRQPVDTGCCVGAPAPRDPPTWGARAACQRPALRWGSAPESRGGSLAEAGTRQYLWRTRPRQRSEHGSRHGRARLIDCKSVLVLDVAATDRGAISPRTASAEIGRRRTSHPRRCDLPSPHAHHEAHGRHQ
jgi:hypothetical protein